MSDENEKPVKVGYTLNVQHIFYQRAVNLSQEFLDNQGGKIPEIEEYAYSYNLPYRLVTDGSEVLIVGAGIGNDVAAVIDDHAVWNRRRIWV